MTADNDRLKRALYVVDLFELTVTPEQLLRVAQQDPEPMLEQAAEELQRRLSGQAQKILNALTSFGDPSESDPVADKDALQPLQDGRRVVKDAVSKPRLKPDDISEGQKKLSDLPRLLQEARQKVLERLTDEKNVVLKDSCMTREIDGAEKYAPPSWSRVTQSREKVTDACSPLTHVNVGRARDLLGDVRQALDDAVEAVAEALRLAAREMLRQLSQFADPDDADRDADRDALAPLHRAIKQVRTALAESDPTPGGVDGAQEVLDSLPDLFQNAEDAIRQRLTNERQQLLTSSLMTDDVEGANDFAQDFLVDVTNGREAVRSALTTLSKKALHDARRELQLLDDATTKLRDAVRDRREKSASLLDAIGPEQAIGANPDGALPKHVVQLNGRRAAVRNAAETRPLTAQRLSEGEDDLRKLRLAHAAAVDAIEKLGGANELGSLAQALGGAARIEELQEAFGFSDFGALATLVANLGGKQELSQLLTKFGSQGLKGVCDHLGGGACVGVLLRDGCGGDITQLDQLHGAFSGDFSKLGGLLEKGGLKQAPQALAAILRLGCGGKAGDFKSFCDGYATDEALEDFQTLIVDGGLGARPECLGQLLSEGFKDAGDVSNRATKLQALAGQLKAGNALPKLAALVGVNNGLVDSTITGGLGDKLAVFGELVSRGCDGDPVKLKELLVEFDVADLKTLNELVGRGGLDAKPDMLGNVLKQGCGGQPDTLKKFCTEFKDPVDQNKLRLLVTRGGFGAGPRGSSDTLASVLQTAYPGAPEKLKELYDAFDGGPPDGKNMSQLGEICDAFNSAPPPPPSLAGPRLKQVSIHVSPISKLKTQYYDTLDHGVATNSTRRLQQGMANDQTLSRIAALGGSSDPDTKQALKATTLAVVASQTLSLDLSLAGDKLEVDRSGAAAATCAETSDAVARLTVDTDLESKARAAATRKGEAAAKLQAGNDSPETSVVEAAVNQAILEANAAATQATLFANQAVLALTSSGGGLVEIEAAANAAKAAAAAAELAVDPIVRTQALNAAKAASLAASAAAELFAKGKLPNVAQGRSQDALNKSVTALPLQTACNQLRGQAAKAEKDLWIAEKNYQNGTGSPNIVQAKRQIATNKRNAVNTTSRDPALQQVKDASRTAREAALMTAIAGDPAALEAQLTAATARAKASAPDASPDDQRAAIEREREAATATRTAAFAAAQLAATPLTANTAAHLVSTYLGHTPPDLEELFKEFRHASAICGASLSAAIDEFGHTEQLLAEADIALKRATQLEVEAQNRVNLANTPENQQALLMAQQAKQAATSAKSQASTVHSAAKQAVTDASDLLKSLKQAAGKISKEARSQSVGLTPTVTANQLTMAQATAGSVALDFETLEGGKPLRDLLRVAATLEKDAMVGLPAPSIGGNTADMKHFCGRHTRKHFTFAKDELYLEEEILDCLMLNAQKDGYPNSALTTEEKDLRGLKRFKKSTSLWPEGTTAANLKKYAEDAVAEVDILVNADSSHTFSQISRAYLDANLQPTQFKHIPVDGGKFLVTIAFGKGAASKYEITQLFPEDVEKIGFFDMHSIKKGLGL